MSNFRKYSLSLSDGVTHKQLWTARFSRTGLFVTILSAVCVGVAIVFSIIAFTPVRTFIPGYPDSHSRQEAITNAIRIDSLENVVRKWAYYAENLRRVLDGDDPVLIDSLVRNYSADTVRSSTANLRGRDSLLRETVRQAEQFALEGGARRSLPIEGVHFFKPLKGVVSVAYDPMLHPYIDISAPANSVVMSVLDGTVIDAGWSDDGGYSLTIQHEDDIISIYRHNEKLLRKGGDKVVAGTPVALVGSTGALGSGEHLRFELWYRGESIDPQAYISF